VSGVLLPCLMIGAYWSSVAPLLAVCLCRLTGCVGRQSDAVGVEGATSQGGVQRRPMKRGLCFCDAICGFELITWKQTLLREVGCFPQPRCM